MQDITNALNENGLLDAEGYLLPPQHKAVDRFTKRLFQLEEMSQTGCVLSADDKQRLKRMHIAFDYYQEALEDEAKELEGNVEDDVVDDDDDDDDEAIEDDDDEE